MIYFSPARLSETGGLEKQSLLYLRDGRLTRDSTDESDVADSDEEGNKEVTVIEPSDQAGSSAQAGKRHVSPEAATPLPPSKKRRTAMSKWSRGHGGQTSSSSIPQVHL